MRTSFSNVSGLLLVGGLLAAGRAAAVPTADPAPDLDAREPEWSRLLSARSIPLPESRGFQFKRDAPDIGDYELQDGFESLGPRPGHFPRAINTHDGGMMAVYVRMNKKKNLGTNKEQHYREIVVTKKEKGDNTKFEPLAVAAMEPHDLDNPDLIEYEQNGKYYYFIVCRDHGSQYLDMGWPGMPVWRITVYRSEDGGKNWDQGHTVVENVRMANEGVDLAVTEPKIIASVEKDKKGLFVTYGGKLEKNQENFDIFRRYSSDLGNNWSNVPTCLHCHDPKTVLRDGMNAVAHAKNDDGKQVLLAAVQSKDMAKPMKNKFSIATMVSQGTENDDLWKSRKSLPRVSDYENMSAPSLAVCDSSDKDSPIGLSFKAWNGVDAMKNTAVYAVFAKGVKGDEVQWSKPMLIAKHNEEKGSDGIEKDLFVMWPSIMCNPENKEFMIAYQKLGYGPIAKRVKYPS